MKNYILNSAVITTPGNYQYRLISVEEMKKWLSENQWISTIGYQQTCDAIQALTNIPIPLNRVQIKMDNGDTALIFRLTCRLDNPELKGKLSQEFVMKNFEAGILTKTA